MPPKTQNDCAIEERLATIESKLDRLADAIESLTETREPEGLISVNEACERLGISRTTFYDLIRAGQVRPVRIGRAVRGSAAESCSMEVPITGRAGTPASTPAPENAGVHAGTWIGNSPGAGVHVIASRKALPDPCRQECRRSQAWRSQPC